MSKLALRFSPEAHRKLGDITTYFMTESDPHFARKQIERLKRAINQLRSFPDMGDVSISSMGPFRRWMVASYVVFYISDERYLTILQIVQETQVPSIYLKVD
jgi:plasmid stabilization system protein ParE